jgi:hypothetical protein
MSSKAFSISCAWNRSASMRLPCSDRGPRRARSALERLADIASQADRPLHFRLFLDPDTAGLDGAYDLILVAAAPARRRRRVRDRGVVPPAQADKADPDTYLRGLVHADAAGLLNHRAYGALEFMLGVRTGLRELPIDPGALSSCNWRAVRAASPTAFPMQLGQGLGASRHRG